VAPDFQKNLVCYLFRDCFIAHQTQDEAEYPNMMALKQQPDCCLLLVCQALEKNTVICAFNHLNQVSWAPSLLQTAVQKQNRAVKAKMGRCNLQVRQGEPRSLVKLNK
jgi:hypothetical protein